MSSLLVSHKMVLSSLRVCLLVLVTSRVVIVGMDGGLASWNGGTEIYRSKYIQISFYLALRKE